MAQQEKEQEVTIIPPVSQLDIFKYQTLLGTGNKYMNLVPLTKALCYVLDNYEMKLWAMEENQEWSTETFNKLTTAKFILVREVLFEQIRKNGRFDIQTNFENPCKKCNGVGERYQFNRALQNLRCMKCEDGKINGETCKTCRGTKIVKNIKGILPELISATTCEVCHGKGYFPPETYDNPVIDRDDVDNLKKKLNLVENTQKTLAEVIHETNVVEPPAEKPIESRPQAEK